MRNSIYTSSVITAVVCSIVGVLAALGMFNSVMNFPIIFSGVLGGLGLYGIWREETPRQQVTPRALILLAGVAAAFAGWTYQKGLVDQRNAGARLAILEATKGKEVPSPIGLEPLNTDLETWNQTASLTGDATIVTFWARWCSPCWQEMEELEQLYREHGEHGLRIVAVTRYDDPEDADSRRKDFDRAKRFLENRELTYPAAITDRNDIYDAYLVSSPPATALVDRDGRVVDYAISLESARDLMDKAVAMLDQSSSG